MKNFMSVFVVLSLAFIVACGQTEQAKNESAATSQTVSEQSKAEEKSEQKVTINISKDHKAEQIEEKEVVIEEGSTLMEVMKENFELETAYEGTFITAIDGVVANEAEKYAWMFFINGEMAQKGAAEIVLKNGDVVNFDMQKWE